MKAVVEMPMGTSNKWEIKKDGKLVIDRVLKMPVPVNYGFIPGTLCEDGDALDVFIISDREYAPGDQAQIDVIGLFTCKDQGVGDDKVLAKLRGAKLSQNEILSHMCRVGHYLLNYKSGFEILDYKSIDESALTKYKSNKE